MKMVKQLTAPSRPDKVYYVSRQTICTMILRSSEGTPAEGRARLGVLLKAPELGKYIIIFIMSPILLNPILIIGMYNFNTNHNLN